jgi:hypothetical protein
MVAKISYTVNAIGQLFLLNAFLGTSYHLYGYEVISSVFRGEDWQVSHTFPRVTMCDFSIRDLNNIRQYTVQCVLPLNFFNEKMYIIIWFWFVMVAIANLLNLLTWVLRVCSQRDQLRYIKHHLRSDKKLQLDNKNREHRVKMRRFVRGYLKKDGVLVLRLVEQNANGLVVSEIIADLFNYYQYSHADTRNEHISDAEEI